MTKAQFIIIGDEILDGHIQDKNIAPLAQTLKELGVHVEQIILARDRADELFTVIDQAFRQSDLVITTGGLGPTKDDMTKEMFAKLSGGTLVENAEAKAIVTKHYERMNRPWSPERNFYHMLPQGVEAVFNPVGLAPGLSYRRNNKMILAAPGVPRELSGMLHEEFVPRIREHFSLGQKTQETFIIRTHSIPEEKIFFELEPTLWQQLEQYGRVSSLPQTFGVDIRLSQTEPKDHPSIQELINNSQLAPYVWQYGNLSLSAFILERARAQGLSLSCAESCTGGLTASLFTDIAGSSDVFMGSAVTYSNEAKMNLLKVKEQTLKDHGAVSVQVVKEMAEGARQVFASDFAVSYSGIAGPGGGSKEKPVGTVAIAVATPQETITYLKQYYGDRKVLKERFTKRGLFYLLEAIESYRA